MRSSTPASRWTIAIALAVAAAALTVPVAFGNFDQWTPVQPAPGWVHALPPEDQGALAGGPQIGAYAVAREEHASHRHAMGASMMIHMDSMGHLHSQQVGAGFKWRDAGIGAGTAIGVVLLGAGAALGTRRGRRFIAATE
jgi:hypothetical protein